MTTRVTYRVALASLVAAHLGLVWLLPVIPGHDLPQHLAMARVLLDHGRADLPLGAYFEVSGGSTTYSLAVWAMAALGRIMSVEAAARVLYSLYVVATFWTFHLLVAACRQERAETPRWTGLLASLLVWSPAAMMGYLQNMLSVPVFVLAVALTLRSGEGPPRLSRLALVAMAAAALAVLHPVSGAAFALLTLIHAACARSRSRGVAMAIGIGATLLAFAAVRVLDPATYAGRAGGHDWAAAIRARNGLDFVDQALNLRWLSPLGVMSHVLWAVLGPYRPAGLVIVAAVAAVVIVVVVRSRGGTADVAASVPRAYRRVALVFALIAAFAPATFEGHLTNVNLRLLALGLPLLLALVDPAWFSARRARAALVVGCVLLLAHFAVRGAAFGREAAPALRLIREARPLGVLDSISLHWHSDHFATLYRFNANLPLYYTTREGGVVTHAWAGNLGQLPLKWRSRPLGTPIWAPWAVRLGNVPLLLVQRATNGDPDKHQQTSARLPALLARHAELVRCEGLWCLYRARTGPIVEIDDVTEGEPAALLERP